jgi:phage/conjugal plasmid C-4 type zinc finger TraR family protein
MVREGLASSRAVEAVEALQRIQDGTYGLCVDCGKRIPAARLAIKPEATRCVACQSEQERRGSYTSADGSYGYAQSA